MSTQAELLALADEIDAAAALETVGKKWRRLPVGSPKLIVEALRAHAQAVPDPEPYLVWSNQHRAWWRPDSRGYTRDIRAAGYYPRDEAIEISGAGRNGWVLPDRIPDEIAVPLSALPDSIRSAAKGGKVVPDERGRTASGDAS